MIADLKPYPATKDSGVPWLGAVPEHWEIERAKWLFRKVDRPTQGSDEVVTCFRDGIVTLRKNRRVRGFTESLKEIGYQGIRRGDLVIHAMDAFAGAIGVADADGKGTPVYSVCEPAPTANAYFYAYTVREMARSQWIQALARGIRERSTDFRFDGFGSQPVPLPPLPEQAAIVRFLDHADRHIRRYIRVKQKLFSLLEEQKHALIHRAVTRGLDSKVQLKPSGVDWLGNVPMRWSETRLKFLTRKITDGEHISPSLAERGVALLSAKDVRDRSIIYDVDKFVTTRQATQFWRRCRPGMGDLLIVSRGATIGRVAIVESETPFCLMGSVILCKLRSEYSPEFLYYALNAHQAQTSLWFASASSAQQAIYIRDVAELRLPVPPPSERQAILRHLHQSVRGIRHAIDQAQREIALLREYRTRLIADVVRVC